jgi:hypothetical protein
MPCVAVRRDSRGSLPAATSSTGLAATASSATTDSDGRAATTALLGDDPWVIAAFHGIDDPETAAAAVAVVVAFLTAMATTPIRFVADNLLQRSKAKTDHDYAERKELRAKTGDYHGRLLEAATSLNYRLGQIYNKRHEHWLCVQGNYTRRWPGAEPQV